MLSGQTKSSADAAREPAQQHEQRNSLFKDCKRGGIILQCLTFSADPNKMLKYYMQLTQRNVKFTYPKILLLFRFCIASSWGKLSLACMRTCGS